MFNEKFEKATTQETEHNDLTILANELKNMLKTKDYFAGKITKGPNSETYMEIDGLDIVLQDEISKIIDDYNKLADDDGENINVQTAFIEDEEGLILQLWK